MVLEEGILGEVLDLQKATLGDERCHTGWQQGSFLGILTTMTLLDMKNLK